MKIDATPIENFLSTPPCPFRRVSFGSAHCTISTDPYVNEVDPLTCHNCDVPGIIAEPRCRYLSLGTELKPYRGEGKLVCSMACRALNIKLYSLKTCDECPLYSPVNALADLLDHDETVASLQVPITEKLVEEIARDIRRDYQMDNPETPPLKPAHCWRFPEGRCRKFPVYVSRKVTINLRGSEKNDALYKLAIEPAIRELNLIAYRIDEEMVGAEQMCRSCENFQESDHVILSLDDWNPNSVFLAGVASGMGRNLILLKDSSLQPVPLIDPLDSRVVHYSHLEELRLAIRNYLNSLERAD